jgi:hypothetical protein
LPPEHQIPPAFLAPAQKVTPDAARQLLLQSNLTPPANIETKGRTPSSKRPRRSGTSISRPRDVRTFPLYARGFCFCLDLKPQKFGGLIKFESAGISKFCA